MKGLKYKERKILEMVFLAILIPWYFTIGKLTNKIDIYQILSITLVFILSIIMYFLLKDKHHLDMKERKKINLHFVIENIVATIIILIISLIMETLVPLGLLGWMSSFAYLLGLQIIFTVIHTVVMVSR
jgi:putative flippase GtrA